MVLERCLIQIRSIQPCSLMIKMMYPALMQAVVIAAANIRAEVTSQGDDVILNSGKSELSV